MTRPTLTEALAEADADRIHDEADDSHFINVTDVPAAVASWLRSDEVLEVVARAIHEFDCNCSPHPHDEDYQRADAALAALAEAGGES